jgi:SlyX protein
VGINKLSVDERIVELEERLMHQEQALEALSIASHRQQNQLDQIQGELKQIRQLLLQMSSGEVGDSSDEPPPPHY